MSNQVYANNMEVSCKQAAGKSICAFPDVCFTPPQTPATPPGVPIPYPNTGLASDTTDGSSTVKISGQEVMLKNKSYFKKSTGDEAGCTPKKGVMTSKNMGKVYFTMWSMDVKVEGEAVARMMDMTTHNHASAPGNSPPWPYVDEVAIPPLPEPPKCPPHVWYEDKSQTPEETKAKNKAEAEHLKTKPSKADQARGPEFENKAIDENMEKMKIKATKVIYRCRNCPVEQEVDIKGENQIAEAKSRTAKGWKNAGEQSRNYREIQSQLFDSKTPPLAKMDNNKADVETSRNKMLGRGHAVELL